MSEIPHSQLPVDPVAREAVLQAERDQKEIAHQIERDDIEFLLDDPELERINNNRRDELRRAAEKVDIKHKAAQYGKQYEITEESFLKEVTGAPFVVCHFFHQEFDKCKIMNNHLTAIAMRHPKTKFIKIDAEKAPFFVTKLAIQILPTVVYFKDGIAVERLVGFEGLGTVDDIQTARVEQHIARGGMIKAKRTKIKRAGKKGSVFTNNDSDDSGSDSGSDYSD